MSSLSRSAAALALVALWSPALASADPPPTAAPSPSPRWYVTVATGAQAYLSPNRTMGGYGGGLGVRALFGKHLFAEADAAYLFEIGNVLALRVSAGLQRDGLWAPAALVSLGVLAGQQFTFFQPGGPTLGGVPAAWIGLAVAPLRFQLGRAQVSVLQLGLGVGTDLPGLGLAPQLQVLEIAVAL